jgi:hypothetical protein
MVRRRAARYLAFAPTMRTVRNAGGTIADPRRLPVTTSEMEPKP